MNSWLIIAQAQGAENQGTTMLLFLGQMSLIFAIFYFIWWRPLRNKQKALDQLLSNLKKGDRIVTSGGFYGEVAKAEGDTVILKLAENLKVKVARRAIAGFDGSSETKGAN